MTFPSTSTTSSLPSTSTPFPATSRLQSFLHSSLTASPLSKPPPPSEKGPSSEPPPSLSLVLRYSPPPPLFRPPLPSPGPLPLPLLISRRLPRPPPLPATATPVRRRWTTARPVDPRTQRCATWTGKSNQHSPHCWTLPSQLPCPRSLLLPLEPLPPPLTSAASSSSTALPALTRLSSSAPISLSDFAFWTDGQVQLRDEISSLHHFGSRRRDEDDGVEEEVLKVSNRALQSLVNAAQDSGNVRHTLLVLSYHLRHLIEQQRKHEARIKFRQRQLQKAQLLLAASHTPGDLTAPLPPLNSSTLPLPTSSTSSPPTFPGEGHWLLCMMSNVRLILQTLLERLPCHHRELFFQHLRRRPTWPASNPPSPLGRRTTTTVDAPPCPTTPRRWCARAPCNDASLSPTAPHPSIWPSSSPVRVSPASPVDGPG